jgi:hypothetical protein
VTRQAATKKPAPATCHARLGGAQPEPVDHRDLLAAPALALQANHRPIST